MNKKLVFIWDFPLEPLEIHGWADGLSLALKYLSAKYELDIYPIASDKTTEIYDRIGLIDPDFILCWGSLDRPSFGAIKQFDKPTGLCFAGGSTKHGNRDNFDVIFVENDEYMNLFNEDGYSAYKAFGVNEILFSPTIQLQPHFQAIYPAAFMPWKRHELFAKAVGHKGLAVGGMNQNTRQCFDICFEHGVMVLPKVPYEVLPFMIAQSQSVLITADNQGGSQRTVLEAMSMNKPLIVMSDNIKCVEFVKESGVGIIADPDVGDIKKALGNLKHSGFLRGREFIMRNYSAEIYADKLWRGIRPVL